LTGAVLNALEIKPSEIDKLQTLPVERLFWAMGKVLGNGPGPGPLMFAPVLDGKILPSHPFSPAASPVSADIPILVGCNTHELSLMAVNDASAFNLDEAKLQQQVVDLVGKGGAGRVIKTYQKMHAGVSPSELYFLLSSDRWMRMNAVALAERKFIQGKAPVYVYLFAWHSPVMGGKLGSPHTAEIPFVFYNTDIPKVMTRGGPEVKELAGRMSDAWIQFARSGDPNHQRLPKWPEFNINDRATMIFDTTCKVVNDPGSVEREMWEDLRVGR
jgi:para-nitrobenzyl esterase